MDTQLMTILFADDTTLWDTGADLERVISNFSKKFSQILEWINFNKLYINWSKTKLMVITKARRSKLSIPVHLEIDGNRVEVVNEFKLLGCTIDDDLTFAKHVNVLRKTVNRKLFAIKNIFFCPKK
jgi:hypothetical protein